MSVVCVPVEVVVSAVGCRPVDHFREAGGRVCVCRKTTKLKQKSRKPSASRFTITTMYCAILYLYALFVPFSAYLVR